MSKLLAKLWALRIYHYKQHMAEEMANAKRKTMTFLQNSVFWGQHQMCHFESFCLWKTHILIELIITLPVSPPTGNCAHFHKGGWWYNACGQANLNGVWYTGGVYRSKFQDGIFWADYGGGFYSMKSVRMLIRPIDWGENCEPGWSRGDCRGQD